LAGLGDVLNHGQPDGSRLRVFGSSGKSHAAPSQAAWLFNSALFASRVDRRS